VTPLGIVEDPLALERVPFRFQVPTQFSGDAVGPNPPLIGATSDQEYEFRLGLKGVFGKVASTSLVI
jgi:hypothetical protein